MAGRNPRPGVRGVLTPASGIDGTMAALLPGREPRWLWVAAVGVIAALHGWLIGIVAAVGVVICYQLMLFGGLNLAPDRDVFLLGAAVVAAIAARPMRFRSRLRGCPRRRRLLLTGITAVAVEVRLMPMPRRRCAGPRHAAPCSGRRAGPRGTRACHEKGSGRASRISVEEIAAELERSKSSLQGAGAEP